MAIFVDKEVIPTVDEHFTNGTFPMELIKELGKKRLFGSFLTGYECLGIDAVKYGIICMEIERGDGGIRSFFTTQGSLVMYAIWRYGTESQKKKYLPKMAKGEIIGCFGLTEKDASSNPAQMKTFAIKDGNKWIINGEKMWITNAPIADFSIIWAKTDDGIKAFIVEMDKDGVEIIKMNSNISLRAFITSGIKLNNVVVPEKNRLPEADGLKASLSCLTEKRYGMAWGAIGAAKDCYCQSLCYAKERIMFGRPVVSSQLVQRKLVNMLIEITKAKAITVQVGRVKEQDKNFRHEMVALIALNNLTKSVEIAREAKEIHGINGIAMESRVIRHLLNLESLNAFEGTNDIYLLIIGRDITGMQAFF
jgi:glutaryl-CoA dehydrogenase